MQRQEPGGVPCTPYRPAIQAPRSFAIARFIDDEARWAAIRRRDPAADGEFVFAVSTTGVYCRSTCAARPARRENVSFHATPVEAEAGGLSPLQTLPSRILPSRAEREANLIAQACRHIEEAEEEPALAALAEKAGLSPHHFHRVVQARHRRDAEGLRCRAPPEPGAGQSRGRIRCDRGYLRVGFNSSGRFYEAVSGMLGMTPSAYRKGGEGEEVCACHRAVLARLRAGRGDETRGLRHPDRRRSRRRCAPICRTVSRKPTLIEPTLPASPSSSPRWCGLVDAPARVRARHLPLDVPRHGVPAAGMGGAAGHSRRRDGELCRHRAPHRRAACRARRGRACAANTLAVAIPATA